jgi:putative addiction module killer protein
MFTVELTETFQAWFLSLRDVVGRTAVARRIDRLVLGNFGDTKSIGGGLSELRVDVGPGYRVYFTVRGRQIVVVLAGGDKSTQQRDIMVAKAALAGLPPLEIEKMPAKGRKKKE